ncbi:MAG: HAD family hydrolase [Candidatus Paceibacteria bacterium]
MQVKGIIFDFFGVIVAEVGHLWFEKHAPNQLGKLQKTYFRQQDLGEISADDLFGKLAELNHSNADRVREEWTKTAHLKQDAVDYIKELRETYKIALLSNAASSFIRHLLEKHGLAPIFDEVVISSEVRMAKPDRDIFELTLTHLNLLPQETVFIDDNPANIEGAKKIGIRGILFKDTQTLRNDLAPLLAL